MLIVWQEGLYQNKMQYKKRQKYAGISPRYLALSNKQRAEVVGGRNPLSLPLVRQISTNTNQYFLEGNGRVSSLWSFWYQRQSNQCSFNHQCTFNQEILKGEVSLYRWPPVWLVWIQLNDFWQFLFLFSNQTDSNQSNRRSMVQSPLSIPCFNHSHSQAWHSRGY